MPHTRTLVFLLFLFSSATLNTAFAATFATTLRIGDTNPDVIALQKILNSSPDTVVSSIGPGSPGHESSYFGSKTYAAVKRFQNKYRSDILLPVGLSKPTGAVGPATLKKLRSLSPLQDVVSVPIPLSRPTPQSNIKTDTSTTTAASTQTSALEGYIGKIRELSKKQGMEPATMALIEEKIRQEAATVDMRKAFIEKEKKAHEQKIQAQTSSAMGRFLLKTVATIEDIFTIQKAQAVAVLVPFGGFVTYVNPIICDCSGVVTQMYVVLGGAAPPISNILLNYVNGSEAFLNYNLPEPGVATLGFYVPAVQSCLTYIGTGCVIVPAVGQITPETGSSLVI